MKQIYYSLHKFKGSNQIILFEKGQLTTNGKKFSIPNHLKMNDILAWCNFQGFNATVVTRSGITINFKDYAHIPQSIT